MSVFVWLPLKILKFKYHLKTSLKMAENGDPSKNKRSPDQYTKRFDLNEIKPLDPEASTNVVIGEEDGKKSNGSKLKGSFDRRFKSEKIRSIEGNSLVGSIHKSNQTKRGAWLLRSNNLWLTGCECWNSLTSHGHLTDRIPSESNLTANLPNRTFQAPAPLCWPSSISLQRRDYLSCCWAAW